MSPGWRRAILAAAVVALLLKSALALRTIGTNDVLTFDFFSLVAAQQPGRNLYLYADPPFFVFNHPPFMIHGLRALRWLGQATSLPFPFWLRAPGIAADLGSLLLVWRILEGSGRRFSPWTLLFIAIAPASIMISGFHGNTDPVMIAFLLLSIYLIQVRRRVGLGGVAMGLSVSVKVVPLLFVPAVVLQLRGWRPRAAFVLSAAATGLLLSLPYAVEVPSAILSRLFGYSSIYGQWGLTRLLQLDGIPLQPFDDLGRALAPYLVPVVVPALSAFLHWRYPRRSLFWHASAVGLATLAIAPGFGVQYLAWAVPWTAATSAAAAVTFHASSGAFLFAVYTEWSQGLPWNFANSFIAPPWSTRVVLLGLACWGSVLFLLWSAFAFRRSDEARE
jgi:hypothetical protein